MYSTETLSIRKELKILFNEIQGVPLQRYTVESELVVTFNMCYLFFLQPPTCENMTSKLALKSLARLVEFYHRQIHLLGTTKEQLQNPYQVLSEIVKLDMKEHQELVVLLLCIWSLSCLSWSNTKEATAVLSCAQNIIDKETNDQHDPVVRKSHHYSMEFSMFSATMCLSSTRNINGENHKDVLVLQDAVSLLVALNQCMDRNITGCLECVSKVKCRNLVILARCLEAYALYDTGDYIKCQKIVKQLFRTGDLHFSIAAFLFNLDGSCLALQNKPHTALQRFKAALQADFSFLMPLYNLSLQYRKLQMWDAELEALNLLVTSLHEERQGGEAGGKPVLKNALFDTSLKTLRANTISLEHAYFALACRCIEQNRYDVAAQTFDKLLKLLQDEGNLSRDSCSVQPFPIPCVWIIYSLTAYSLLRAKCFQDCLLLCNTILTCTENVFCQPQNLPKYGLEELHQISKNGEMHLVKSKKRLRSEENIFSSWSSESSLTAAIVHTHIYKAHCLSHLQKIPDALQCMNCCEKLLDSFVMGISPALSQQPQKRPRLDEGGTSMSKSDMKLPKKGLNKLLADVCSMQAQLCVAGEDFKQALYHTTLAIQHMADDTDCHYNHSLVLLKMARKSDMAHEWLSHRGYNFPMDSLQIDDLILQLHKGARLQRTSSSTHTASLNRCLTETDYLKMDVTALNLLKKKHDNTA